jgi:hypothetical protein
VARDLIGLSLAAAGTAGLLGALYAASPALALLLAALAAAGVGGAILYGPPGASRARVWCGYSLLGTSTGVLVVLALVAAPWTVLFAALAGVGVWLSGEEA